MYTVNSVYNINNRTMFVDTEFSLMHFGDEVHLSSFMMDYCGMLFKICPATVVFIGVPVSIKVLVCFWNVDEIYTAFAAHAD